MARIKSYCDFQALDVVKHCNLVKIQHYTGEIKIHSTKNALLVGDFGTLSVPHGAKDIPRISEASNKNKGSSEASNSKEISKRHLLTFQTIRILLLNKVNTVFL